MAVEQKAAKKRERPRVPRIPRTPRRSWLNRIASALQALGVPQLTGSTHAVPQQAYHVTLLLSLCKVESLVALMRRDQEEIEQLKAETRDILNKFGAV
jgi:hypothetical protein